MLKGTSYHRDNNNNNNNINNNNNQFQMRQECKHRRECVELFFHLRINENNLKKKKRT